MNKISILTTVLLTSLIVSSFSGCATWDKLDSKERGAVIGGGSGALIGGSGGNTGGALLGGAVGAVGGGLIGNELDKRDDRNDRRRY